LLLPFAWCTGVQYGTMRSTLGKRGFLALGGERRGFLRLALYFSCQRETP